MDIAPGDTQRLAANPAADVGNLRRGDDGDSAVFHIGKADMGLDMTVLHHRGVIPAVDLDQTRLLDCFLEMLIVDPRVGQNVIRMLVVDGMLCLADGFLHIQNKRVFLILDLYSPHALHCRDFVLRDDDGNIVTIIPDMGVEQLPIRRVTMTGVQRPGVARRGELNIRDIKTGDNLDHTGDTLRLGGVNVLYHTMGNGRVNNLCNQGILRDPVSTVQGAAGRLVVSIHTLHT